MANMAAKQLVESAVFNFAKAEIHDGNDQKEQANYREGFAYGILHALEGLGMPTPDFDELDQRVSDKIALELT